MKLLIGNQNYSSWSMRAWVLMRAFDVPFETVKLRFDFTPGSAFYAELARYTPAGQVPVLIEDDGFAVWDTLAIVERLAERLAHHAIWPRDERQRARARSVCAEMHAGFQALRQACPMNIEAALAGVGAERQAHDAAVQADLARLDALWTDALTSSGGPFLFGEFCAADAYFAPVAMRVSGYGLTLSPPAMAYVQRLSAHPAVAAWVAQARAEGDYLDFEEPYRTRDEALAQRRAG